ncbi:PadR family transcriptional regulator [Heliobacterium gestii]|uniref:PadR family transcriptional regulator n=1 Tax=Heliomicrobium gestii TaxID=2699 RepID=A0A845L7D6_HELGE|nr:PadR family transcriptional regulator [Heliomicrobium gestii]MBM7866141.1 DNA-binding PadR family transcriptional regulator [Heliomicrobium gestii]MZP42532.1 PadR family transcriptional regulator [Heliomicrobium gestii]
MSRLVDSLQPEESSLPYTVGRINRFVQPALLLLLSEKPSYGYELMERIGELVLLDGPTDPALIYRTLRRMEEEQLVRSNWQTGESGPAKRCYELTDRGVETLHRWAREITRHRRALDEFLCRYRTHFNHSPLTDKMLDIG